MAKTSKQIQGDVYRMLRDSDLHTKVSGDVYLKGKRPRNSKLEDIVVCFTTGITAQVQTGIVTINIYVPDIDPFDNGVMTEDDERTCELEIEAQQWVDRLKRNVTEYNFQLQKSIYTEEDTSINQHFVVVKLYYERFDNERQ